MIRGWQPLVFVMLLCGCASKNYKVHNPVVGPAPPRINNPEAVAELERTAAVSEIELAGFNTREAEPLLMTDVVARVNGKPILAGDVLEQYAVKLAGVRNQVSEAQFRQLQEKLAERELPNLIEQTLMADAVRARLKPEQLEGIDGQLGKMFDLQVQELMEQTGSNTVMDLEAKMQEQGLSLVTMQKLFSDRALASEYVRQRVGDPPPVTPEQLKAAYRERLDSYREPAQVKWQQLQVTKAGGGSLEGARRKLQQALAELERGADFDEVVKKYSDGPLARNGGHWDWMRPEDVANPQVQRALRELPVGQISETIESNNGVQVVRVTGRREETVKPFAAVQDELRKEINQKWREEQAKKIVAELKQTAVIETMFDGR